MGKEYKIADIHFDHDKPFINEDRGFSNIKEYNEGMIDIINSIIKPGDRVTHLGDFSWSNPEKFLEKLNGKWAFVEGNHDKGLYQSIRNLKQFDGYYKGFVDAKYNEQYYTECHYPMICWNKSHYNAWLLYGHVHGKVLPLLGKTLDVSPVLSHLQPYEMEEITEIMKTKPNNWDLIERLINK